MNTADLCSCVNIWNCVTPSGVNVRSSSCPQCVNRLAALGGREGSAAAKRPDEETLRGGNSPLAGGRRSVWAAQRRLWCGSEGEEGDQSPTEEKHQRWLDNANASCYPACITAERYRDWWVLHSTHLSNTSVCSQLVHCDITSTSLKHPWTRWAPSVHQIHHSWSHDRPQFTDRTFCIRSKLKLTFKSPFSSSILLREVRLCLSTALQMINHTVCVTSVCRQESLCSCWWMMLRRFHTAEIWKYQSCNDYSSNSNNSITKNGRS